MTNPMIKAFADLQEDEDLMISFPFKYEGKWYQAELGITGDNTFGFFQNGVRTEVALSEVVIWKGKRK